MRAEYVRRAMRLGPILTTFTGLSLWGAGSLDAQQMADLSVYSVLDTQGRTIELGREVSGSLGPVDPLTGEGRRVQVWTLEVEPGREVQVDLRSDAFDSFLYVVGPGLGEGLRDDDGGAGLNSRICFTPDQPGDYRVVASSLGGGTGVFELVAAASEGTCGGAANTSSITDLSALATESRTLSAGEEVEGTLTPSDPTFYGSAVQAWAVEGEAGEAFSVDLVSDDFDSFLMLRGPGGVELDDDDGAGRCDSRISLTFPETGTYSVIASTLGSNLGSYRLRASGEPGPGSSEPCVPSALGEDGGAAVDVDAVPVVGSVSVGDEVAGHLNGDEPLYQGRRVQAWTLEASAGDSLAITLRSDQLDTYLFFSGPGFFTPRGDDDGAGDLDSRLCLVLSEDGPYTILPGSFSSSAVSGPYRLQVLGANAGSVCDEFERSDEANTDAVMALAADGEVLAVGGESSGRLDGSRYHPEDDRPVAPWIVRGEPGSTVYVDLITDQFDAYLFGYLDEGGAVFEQRADDHEGSRNSRMELTLPSSGEATILASAFGSDGRGEYRIRASVTPPPLEPSSGGSGADFAGSPGVTGDNALDGLGETVASLEVGSQFSGVLGEGDPVLERGYAQAFAYEGEAGETVIFELMSEAFDTYLYLAGPGLEGVLYDDDGSWGSLDSRIEVTLPESGTYTVVVSAISEGGTGPFRLYVVRPVG